MANFKIIKELASIERDKGLKRLLVALYEASDDDGSEPRRYIATSEQARKSEDNDWESSRKGITVRRGEIGQLISALQSADFDAKPDGKGLSCEDYLALNPDLIV